MLKIIKVTGSSLSPVLLSGDYVVVWGNPRRFAHLKTGEIVVCDHPFLGTLIKRVRLNNPREQTLELEGIHSTSISSNSIGPIPYQNVIGSVILHVKRPH